jgi:2-phospho-L-lactate transferase/gluconeogenesis factor (CofD/UPF0052 family)
MTKHGESDGFAASDFVREIKTYLENGKLDYVLLNKGAFPERMIKRYEKENAHPVLADVKNVKKLAKNVIVKTLVSAGTLLRHDSGKIARTVVDIANR